MDTKIVTETSMVVTFESAGLMFTCLNGGSHFKFNPSISFFVLCETEEEVDFAWNQLVNEGTVLMPLDQYDWSKKYGWVKDRYGVTWQLSFGKMQEVGQKITPCFMFVGEQYGRAEEALNFYSSIFKESAVDGILRYGNNEFPDKEGAVKHAQFSLSGQKFMVMESNHDHQFSFNEAISFVVNCETQEEIDYYWNRLTDGGQEGECGWLKDSFGVSWQVVPVLLSKFMSDPTRSENVVQALRTMKKIDIEKLRKA